MRLIRKEQDRQTSLAKQSAQQSKQQAQTRKKSGLSYKEKLEYKQL